MIPSGKSPPSMYGRAGFEPDAPTLNVGGN
jgi:hypothetical protein